MGDFITPPTFGGTQFTRAGFFAQISLTQTVAGSSSIQRLLGDGGGVAGQVLGPRPLETGVATDYNGAFDTVGASTPASPDSQYGSVDASIAAAQTAVSSKQSDRDGAAQAVDTANLSLHAAREAEVAAHQTLYRAGHAVAIVTARLAQHPPTATDEQLAAARAVFTSVQTAAEAATALVAIKDAAVAEAQGTLHLAGFALTAAKAELRFLQRYRGGIPAVFDLAVRTHDSYVEHHPVTTPATPASAYPVYTTWAPVRGGAYLDFGLVQFPTFANPTFPVLYGATFQGETYRQQFAMPDAAYRQFLVSGKQIRLRWSVVTHTYPAVAGSVPPTDYPFEYSRADYESNQVTYGEQSEIFSASGAVQDLDGSWLFTGAAHDLPLPATAKVVAGAVPDAFLAEIRGLPMVPMVEIVQIEFRGGERIRQGWQAFETAPGQITPRYLSMSASAAAGAPPGTNYSGRLQLEPPPYLTDEPEWLEPNDYDPDLAPLIIQDYLSGQTHEAIDNSNAYYVAPQPTYNIAGEFAPPDARFPYGPGDDATVLSATVRRMNNPPFLVWTLGDPQTPQMIYDEVSDLAAQPWHNDDDDPYVSSIYGLNRAIDYLSPDGDYAIKQTLRYKLVFHPQDSRNGGASFSVTYRWGLRRRNLVTGKVTLEVQTKTATYPGASGIGLGGVDEEWREVSAGPQESVEIIPLRGINNEPHTFWPAGGYLAQNVTNPAQDPRMWSFVDDPVQGDHVWPQA